MIFGLSSQLFYPQRLTPAHLDALAQSGAAVIELFAARHHVDYTDRKQTRELAAWFRDAGITPTLHAPLSTDERFSRHAAPTLNLVASAKPARIEAMEELKRALELAETIPIATCVLHLGLAQDVWSDYTLEHALTAIEHLKAFAAPLGVRLLLENLPNPIATPEHLLEILRVGHFDNCGLCLDLAHAHLAVSSEPETSIAEVIEQLRPRIFELHLSDNDGRTDAHLWPASGNERPATLATGTIDWFNLYAALDSLPATTPAILEIADTQLTSPADATRIAREVLSHAARLRQSTDS